MKLREKLRHYWHETYYFLAPKSGVEFGMKCREVVEKIDLGQRPATWIGRFRIRLHLSFCQACKNYFDISQALKRAIRGLMHKGETSVDLERLNQELMKKHAQDRDR